MLRKMRLFLLLLLGSLFITACGQKGPLYKTPAPQVSPPKKVVAPKPMLTPEEQAEATTETRVKAEQIH
ncbi:LPS translocon maturation chaperone LptM [Shewanella putrefaciens]|uniref:LPS translocon maturation chaperone LptM n=1 Tax=Shewanella putrefaciens TaxID=24 RepID=UPI000E0FD849